MAGAPVVLEPRLIYYVDKSGRAHWRLELPPPPRPKIEPPPPKKRSPRPRRKPLVGIDIPLDLLRDESGVVMIEAILVLPVMIALTFGCVQWGLISMAQAGLNTAAVSVARDWAIGSIGSEAAAEAALTAKVHELVNWVPVGDIGVEDTQQDGDILVVRASVPGAAAGVLGLVPSPETISAAALVTKQP